MSTKIGNVTISGDLKTAQVAFMRKRDGQLVNVSVIELLKQFKNADFINDELCINGEICVLSSLQDKYEPLELTVAIASNGGDGTFRVEETTYEANHAFTVNKGTAVAITLIPDENSEVESVVDDAAQPYTPVENVVTITVREAMTVTVTFCAKQAQQ